MKKIVTHILNFIFPQKCIWCEKENDILCEECLAKIDYPTLPMSNNIFVATDYNDPVSKKAIWLLKYQGVKHLAKPLAKLIHRRSFKKALPIGDPKSKWVIIPIPLSKKRLKERGFNQSELLAKHLSDRVSIRKISDVLYKKIHTDTQVSIKDRKERLNNLSDTFALKNIPLITDKNIILIDDVTTTGATIREARKLLRENGAKRVVGMVVARG